MEIQECVKHRRFLDNRKLLGRQWYFTDIGQVGVDENQISEEENIFWENNFSTQFTDGQRLLLRLALVNCTQRQRQVLFGIYFLGETNQEIADKLGIAVSGVNRHHRRALRMLRKICLNRKELEEEKQKRIEKKKT